MTTYSAVLRVQRSLRVVRGRALQMINFAFKQTFGGFR